MPCICPLVGHQFKFDTLLLLLSLFLTTSLPSLPILRSLTKSVDERPKYNILVEHPFIKMIESMEVDVGAWYRDILAREETLRA